MSDTVRLDGTSKRLAWGAGVLGFALGGFFDGILLHQVLQWHHLFSLVPGETWRDMRMQIMMDGWFHVLHYGIALIGLWLMWTARGAVKGLRHDRLVLGAALLGFSIWQFVDVILFHWVLMIHRIRVDVPNPLVYDIGWLVVFGVTSLLAAAAVWRSGRTGGGGKAVPALVMSVLVAGPMAGVPAQTGTTYALFPIDADPAVSLTTVAQVGSDVVWSSASGDLIAFNAGSGLGGLRQAWYLYTHGALVVGNMPGLGGCVGWARSSA